MSLHAVRRLVLTALVVPLCQWPPTASALRNSGGWRAEAKQQQLDVRSLEGVDLGGWIYTNMEDFFTLNQRILDAGSDELFINKDKAFDEIPGYEPPGRTKWEQLGNYLEALNRQQQPPRGGKEEEEEVSYKLLYVVRHGLSWANAIKQKLVPGAAEHLRDGGGGDGVNDVDTLHTAGLREAAELRARLDELFGGGGLLLVPAPQAVSVSPRGRCVETLALGAARWAAAAPGGVTVYAALRTATYEGSGRQTAALIDGLQGRLARADPRRWPRWRYRLDPPEFGIAEHRAAEVLEHQRERYQMLADWLGAVFGGGGGSGESSQGSSEKQQQQQQGQQQQQQGQQQRGQTVHLVVAHSRTAAYLAGMASPGGAADPKSYYRSPNAGIIPMVIKGVRKRRAQHVRSDRVP